MNIRIFGARWLRRHRGLCVLVALSAAVPTAFVHSSREVTLGAATHARCSRGVISCKRRLVAGVLGPKTPLEKIPNRRLELRKGACSRINHRKSTRRADQDNNVT
jgi:hypothetical protein